MDHHAQLALLQQDLERLLSLRDPALIEGWKPTEDQREVYSQLLERILNGIDEYRSGAKRRIANPQVLTSIGGSALAPGRERLAASRNEGVR